LDEGEGLGTYVWVYGGIYLRIRLDGNEEKALLIARSFKFASFDFWDNCIVQLDTTSWNLVYRVQLTDVPRSVNPSASACNSR